VTPDIVLWLAQDGITNGAFLLLGAVAGFSVTRVIFVPQGEFISYAALSGAAAGWAGARRQRAGRRGLLAGLDIVQAIRNRAFSRIWLL
jgi:branched-subunit amino acid ABC-type transport system permease component